MECVEQLSELSCVCVKFLDSVKKEPRERRERADRVNKFQNEWVKLEYKFKKLYEIVKSEPNFLKASSPHLAFINQTLLEQKNY